jgi:hypothetical protein
VAQVGEADGRFSEYARLFLAGVYMTGSAGSAMEMIEA